MKLEFIPEVKESWTMLSVRFIALALLFSTLSTFANDMIEWGVPVSATVLDYLTKASLVCAGIGRLLKEDNLIKIITDIFKPTEKEEVDV